jgi:hypothetical protein
MTRHREKIFSKHVSSKGFVVKIYKELLKPNNNKTTHLKNGQRSEQMPHQRRHMYTK